MIFVKNEKIIKQELELTKEKLKDNEAKQAHISKSLDNLKQDLSEKNDIIAGLTKSIESKTKDMTKLENKITELNESISNITKENQKMKAECDKIKIELNTSNETSKLTIDNLQKVLRTETSSKEDAIKKNHAMKAILADFEEKNKLVEANKEELETKLKEAKSEYEKLKVDYDKIQGVISYFKAHV